MFPQLVLHIRSQTIEITATCIGFALYWNMAYMVNAVYSKEKARRDVVKDQNGKRAEYDTHLETGT